MLTDQPEAHQRSIVAARGRPRPGAIGALAEIGEPAVAGCDPWDVRALIPQLAGLPYPVVLKPATGVASEDVVLVHDPQELARRASEIARRRPGERLIAEEYLTGQLRTAEVLGDGTTTRVLGGFRTSLSAPPFFVEERLSWDPPPPEAEKHVLSALAALGGSFGPGHAEYALGTGPRLIEVNDRLIGDHCDFLLSDLLGLDLFELTLRIYLGEPLPPGGPPPAREYPLTEAVVASRSGVLAAAPPADPAAVKRAVRDLRTSGAWEIVS